MPSNLEAIGPILVSRSDLLERLVDFEIEPGAEFVVELLESGYSLGEEWESLPKSAHASAVSYTHLTLPTICSV